MQQRLLLILASDPEERRGIRNQFFNHRTPQFFSAADFPLLLTEIQTLGLFQTERLLCLCDTDKLTPPQVDLLIKALDHLPDRLYLCLEAETLKGILVAYVQKQGRVERMAVEKPWEKQNRLAHHLSKQAQQEGVAFSADLAKRLVEAMGSHLELLQTELEKLICYVGDKKAITLADMQALSPTLPQETIWQLSDAIYAGQPEQALKILWGLLQEQMAPISLVTALRAQAESNARILQLSAEGIEAVLAEFPYLKGKLYDKKMNLLRRYGESRLSLLLDRLFQTECALKNSPADPKWPLEKLILEMA